MLCSLTIIFEEASSVSLFSARCIYLLSPIFSSICCEIVFLGLFFFMTFLF